jgi:hypothetical protein
MTDPVFTAVWCLLAAVFMALAWIQWTKRPLADAFETEKDVGSMGDASVSIAFDGRQHWVEMVFYETAGNSEMRVHAYLTSSEALLVSQWLRTAALPGRTLADARRRSRRISA